MKDDKEVIYKYEIEIRDKHKVNLPAHCQILYLGVQKVGFMPNGTPDERVYIWVKVNPYHKAEKRYFAVYGTGHGIETKEDKDLIHIGSFQFENGFVGHVFEII